MSEHAYALALMSLPGARRLGKVREVAPGRIRASGPLAKLGEVCEVGPRRLKAEVAAIGADYIVLVPLEAGAQILPGEQVEARPSLGRAPVGESFAGRLIDAMGRALDGGSDPLASQMSPLEGEVLAPLQRENPAVAVETGIRAIDALLPLAKGQRVGVFSASGAGKSTLMSELAFSVAADRCVICLVGERGREVEAFWSKIAKRPDRARYTCVAATSDLFAPLRARAVMQALALAEYWRSRGEHVLLLVDSITRVAMALREIGLAAGAPPALRAYTPNVFSVLPHLVERCGAAKAGGAITAVMTVLCETDDTDDPIAEIMKSLLDGHIVLSRQLCDQGHYPPIDIVRSISRNSDALMKPEHARAAERALGLLAIYDEARLMIENGLYKPGAESRIDEAVRAHAPLMHFLRQRRGERSTAAHSIDQLAQLTMETPRHA